MARDTPSHWCPKCGLVYWYSGAGPCVRCKGVVTAIPDAQAAAYLIGGQSAVDIKPDRG